MQDFISTNNFPSRQHSSASSSSHDGNFLIETKVVVANFMRILLNDLDGELAKSEKRVFKEQNSREIENLQRLTDELAAICASHKSRSQKSLKFHNSLPKVKVSSKQIADVTDTSLALTSEYSIDAKKYKKNKSNESYNRRPSTRESGYDADDEYDTHSLSSSQKSNTKSWDMDIQSNEISHNHYDVLPSHGSSGIPSIDVSPSGSHSFNSTDQIPPDSSNLVSGVSVSLDMVDGRTLDHSLEVEGSTTNLYENISSQLTHLVDDEESVNPESEVALYLTQLASRIEYDYFSANLNSDIASLQFSSDGIVTYESFKSVIEPLLDNFHGWTKVQTRVVGCNV